MSEIPQNTEPCLGPSGPEGLPGPTLGGYRLVRRLGRGGMGEVWQAFDFKLERNVAIKLLRPEYAANPDLIRRFYREARAIARLDHPNIMKIHAIEEQHGTVFLVAEMVRGETVRQVLQRRGKLPCPEASAILVRTVAGLGYALQEGIVHRDIKPDNLMVTPNRQLKIMDFGLAKMLDQDSGVTAAGVVMGSPSFMSPEQIRGEDCDHRSDIYSLGVTYFQMLTGTLPFQGQQSYSVLLKHLNDPFPEPDELKELMDGAVLRVIRRMTAKNVAERYQSYSELLRDLAAGLPDYSHYLLPIAEQVELHTAFGASDIDSGERARQAAEMTVAGVGGATAQFSRALKSIPSRAPLAFAGLSLAIGAAIASFILMQPVTRARKAVKDSVTKPVAAAVSPVAATVTPVPTATVSVTSIQPTPSATPIPPAVHAPDVLACAVAGTLPDVRQMHGSAVIANRLFIFGGNTPLGWKNDVQSAPIEPSGKLGPWREERPMPEMRCYLGNVIHIVNDRVYVIGGGVSLKVEGADAEVINAPDILWCDIGQDGTLGVWNQGVPFPDREVRCTTACASETALYAIGGRTATGNSSAVFVSQIGKNGVPGPWAVGPPLPLGLWFHSAALFNKQVVVWGGLLRQDNTMPNSECFAAPVEPNGTIGNWKRVGSLPEPLYQAVGSSYAGVVFSLCGRYKGGYTTNAVWWTREAGESLAEWKVQKTDLKSQTFHAAALDRATGRLFISGGQFRMTAERATRTLVNEVQVLPTSDIVK